MPEKRYDQRKLIDFALRMAADIAATIAVPVSALAWIARQLDVRAGNTKPVFVALAILVSFALSTVIVSQKAVKYGDKYVALTSDEDEDEKDPA